MDIFNCSDLEIISVVRVCNKETNSQFLHYGDFIELHQLIYVVSGEAEVSFNNTDFYNEPGSVIFLPKGKCSNYKARIIKEEVCFAIFFDADFKAHPQFDFNNFLKNQKISLMFEKIYRTWLRKEIGYYNKCKSIFYSILSEMESAKAKYAPKQKYEKIINAVDYIHEHYTESDFEFNKLHLLCNLSYTHFKRLFAEHFCTTPSGYVRKLRIQRACEMLTTNNFSVTQTAHACGFSDMCYFSKVFKNETGIPPSAYHRTSE